MVEDSCWLLSASQKWIIVEEQETEPGLCQLQSCFSLVGSQQLAVLLSCSSAEAPLTN